MRPNVLAFMNYRSPARFIPNFKMRFLSTSGRHITWCIRRMLCNIAAQQIHKELSNKIIYRLLKEFNLGDVTQKEIIDKLKQTEITEDKQWMTIRDVLTSSFRVPAVAVDSNIISLCSHYKNFKNLVGYVKFLERNNYKLTLSIMGLYISSYCLKNEPITAEEEAEILNIYSQIRKEHSVLDGITCMYCISALLLTKKWKESLELVDMLIKSGRHSPSIMNLIISKAFKNNDPELAWKLINERSNYNLIVSGPVYIDYLEYCKKNFKNDEVLNEIMKMMNFWKNHDIIVHDSVVNKYVDFFKSIGYTANETSISKTGNCLSCKHVLQSTAISNDDFNALAKSILKNVIIGTSVYCKTSPQELKRYILFLETIRPYDIVIDGLNVAYVHKNTRLGSSSHGQIENILDVVNFFHNQNKRILVFGRAHMSWWKKEAMKALMNKAEVFLLKNISHDDPFLLHLCLASGPKTHFVSNDLMRQHKTLIDADMQKLFKRWQLSRQYKLNRVNNKIKLLPPLPFDIRAQDDKDGWHLPSTSHAHLNTPDSYEVPENWVCLRKKT